MGPFSTLSAEQKKSTAGILIKPRASKVFSSEEKKKIGRDTLSVFTRKTQCFIGFSGFSVFRPIFPKLFGFCKTEERGFAKSEKLGC